jgi:hypothetical protein
MAIATPGRIAEVPRQRIVQHQIIRRRRLAALRRIRLQAIAVTPRTRRRLIVALPRRGRTEEAVAAALLAEAAVIRAAVPGEAVAEEGPTAAVLRAGIRPEAPHAAGK